MTDRRHHFIGFISVPPEPGPLAPSALAVTLVSAECCLTPREHMVRGLLRGCRQLDPGGWAAAVPGAAAAAVVAGTAARRADALHFLVVSA